ncbi:G-type lectin S-receptor-like serine/threonine-protein kinase LECRK3 [Tanacetum coccineum]|uniref:G-type lectin S-receptor-like serine/threonine-protein kinase LECRK3 n=1 Tax=Tanacetum coccineum TaxID=301880 RepID=A0ABQ5DCR3_9ASTR
MAVVILHLIILTTFVQFVTAQQTNGSVSVGALLMATPDAKPWVSSSGEFAFGFQQMQGTDNFLLPTQVMERGGVINSKRSKTNFSRGRFQLRLLQDGNLVLNSRDIASDFAYDPYYTAETDDPSNQSDSGDQVVFDATGYMYVLKRNGQRIDLTSRNAEPPSGDYYHRVTLDSDGALTRYSHAKNPTSNTSWEEIWLVPARNICARSIGLEGSKACGLNNVCSLDTDRPNCECPRGFSLLDPNISNGDCKPDFTPSCDEGSGKDVYDFIELTDVNWPLDDYMRIRSVYEQDCKNYCAEDCFFCAPQRPPQFSGENKDKKSLVFVGPVLLGSTVFVFIVLSGVICVGFFLINKYKARNQYPTCIAVDTNLPHFTYQELVEATGGFKDELGKGAFGIVYTRRIVINKVVVKKLNRKVISGITIYEYMSNGTIASFLFEDIRPCWELRRNIALGIAKGLSYLHEECSTQVIHCDIKPQNILLDDYYNAKISDFGLAKLLMINQSQTSTGIRGTKGYVAPEWFRNTPITAKVDVYSFGVLLLEIISCRKSLQFESGNEDKAVLTDWVWDCYQEGRLDTFVENDLEALDDYKRLKTLVMVAIWCVQETPSLRPTMRKVIQMLEGIVEVSEPPCPFLSLVPTLI